MREKLKTRWPLLLAAVCLAVYFWPRPLSGLQGEDTVRVLVSVSSHNIADGVLESTNASAEFSASEPAFQQFGNALAGRSYHLSWRTLPSALAEDIMLEGGGGTTVLISWIGEDADGGERILHTLVCSGSGEVEIDGMVYRMGLLGDGGQQELIQAVSQLAAESGESAQA